MENGISTVCRGVVGAEPQCLQLKRQNLKKGKTSELVVSEGMGEGYDIQYPTDYIDFDLIDL